MPAMTEAAQVGKRQEIHPKIWQVESTKKTKFMTLLKESSAPNQMLMSWLGYTIPASPSTGTLDGTPATARKRVERYPVEGCGHYFRREWGVSTLAGLTNIVGGINRNEPGWQKLQAMIIMKRMIEIQLLSADDCAVEAGATPWTTRGVLKWLQSTAQDTKPVPAQLLPAAANFHTGALSTLDEDAFRALMKSAWGEKLDELSLDGFLGADLKAHIDDFTNVYNEASTTAQARTQYQVMGNDAYVNKVEFLKFSFGEARLHLSPYIGFDTATGLATAYTPKSGVFLDMEMWDLPWLMKPANTNLAPDGSGENGFIDAVGGLRCFSPKGQPAVYTNS